MQSVFRDPKLGYESLIWTGSTESRYEFQNHAIGETFARFSGVYIFCKAGPEKTWHPIYVGETDDFGRSISDELWHHPSWNCIVAAGATHICTLAITSGSADRRLIESDLRQSLRPTCNK